MALTPTGYEHKLLFRTRDGCLMEDGKRLFGSFEQRCDELVDLGWKVATMWPGTTTFTRMKAPRRIFRNYRIPRA
jgi:hypothetical protein